eukprot:g11851.t1
MTPTPPLRPRSNSQLDIGHGGHYDNISPVLQVDRGRLEPEHFGRSQLISLELMLLRLSHLSSRIKRRPAVNEHTEATKRLQDRARVMRGRPLRSPQPTVESRLASLLGSARTGSRCSTPMLARDGSFKRGVLLDRGRCTRHASTLRHSPFVLNSQPILLQIAARDSALKLPISTSTLSRCSTTIRFLAPR